jgi:hypothetical protein
MTGRRWIVAGILIGAGLCAAGPPIAGQTAGAIDSAWQDPLVGTMWRLVEFRSMNDAIGSVRPEDPSLYIMHLNGDGTVRLRLNCNYANGAWSASPDDEGEGGRFEFGALAATGAACSQPSLDEDILTQARFIRSYQLKDGSLYLSVLAEGGVYVWEPYSGTPPSVYVPASPEDGGPRNWEVTGVSFGLNLRERPSTSADVLAKYAPGTMLDNLGTVRIGDQFWCDVQELGGGPRGFVSAEFLKPAVSPDGRVAMGPDDSATRAGQGDFDATGYLPCARSSGQPLRQCGFGVARSGGGYATVVVKRPDGRTRAIYFRMGQPIGADTSQADGYQEFRATKDNDLHIVRVGGERYRIPEAVVLGG